MIRQIKTAKEKSVGKVSLDEFLDRQNRNSAILDRLKETDFKANLQNMVELKTFISSFCEICFNKSLGQSETDEVADYFLSYAERTEERRFIKFRIWVLSQKIMEKIR